MKLGVLADIHGDISNLKSALNFFAQQRVDHILCAGDLVDRGGSGDAVVRLIRDRNIPTVRGNHDETPWDARFLSSETHDYLCRLPRNRLFNWDGVRIVLAHGAPWDNWTYVYPDSPASLLSEVASYQSADLVILGHTHRPMALNFNDGKTWIVNPGSASRFASQQPTCAIVSLTKHNRTFAYEAYAIPTFDTVNPAQSPYTYA